jgi:transcription termination factor Rho
VSETTDLAGTGTQDASGTSEATAASGTTGSTRRRGNGLSGMLLPELQRLAGELGISGTGRMRKGDLVAAISARQVVEVPAPSGPSKGGAPDGAPEARGIAASSAPLEAPITGGANGGPLTAPAGGKSGAESPTVRTRRSARRPAGAPAVEPAAPVAEPAAPVVAPAAPAVEPAAPVAAPAAPVVAPAAPAVAPVADSDTAPRTDDARTDGTSAAEPAASAPAEGDLRTDGDRPQRSRNARNRDRDRDGSDRGTRDAGTKEVGARDGGARDGNREVGARDGGARDGNREVGARDGGARDGNRESNRGGRPDNRNDNRTDAGRTDSRTDNRTDGGPRNDEDDDDFEGGRGRRGRRYRDRNKRGGPGAGAGAGRERFDQSEPTVSDDDVLLPVAGILDVLDNYAFVRTSGYLTGPNDVYVSLSQVRRYGLRRGDAITGAVRQPRDGERKDKYNALVRLDSVNGLDPDQAKDRPEFTKLTPLYPQDRLRLETEPHHLTGRVMDLVMPIGKGQRALIVSPPKAGKTMVLQAIANAITTNNPECHLMVVLVDERPEEVTDMQRSVKGEVIASTFDRPPSDHTTVAELSIERAKRLVEMGHDVVVLLDSITRLGRAYNLAAPASGRILSGGVDSTALYPPKRFLGAARNIENGGSLTIIASALVETGSTMDTVIFEEFKGTGNAEIKLDRRLADKRVFPAVDVNASGTRKEEILMSPDELAIVIKLRRVLGALEPQQALELLLDKLKKTRNNIEFLMQIQKTTLGPGNE